MLTPFDSIVEAIKKEGYHNHRRQEHSDLVSSGILRDLLSTCASLKEDMESGIVKAWLNVKAPGGRKRKIDLFIGEPGLDGRPKIEKVRICIEHKSVTTAHRNCTSRFDDLNETMKVVLGARSEAVVAATVIVGTAPRVLNVPDHVKKRYRKNPQVFEREIVPRLSSGDSSLWDEFSDAVSLNDRYDAEKTQRKMRELPTRLPGHTHVTGYDFVLLVPMFIDNVNPPFVDRNNRLGIDVDSEYRTMLEQICKSYGARWHL